MSGKNRNRTRIGDFKNRKALLVQPTSGGTELPVKSAALETKTKTKRTNAKIRIIVKKLSLLNKISKVMNNNNEINVDTANLSDLDVLDQTMIEFELSGNEPSIQNDSEVPEIPEEETSEEEHGTELNQNNVQNAETNEEQPRYVFETVEGGRFIIQGTSDRRVKMITLDQGGNQSPQEDSGSENENEVIELTELAEARNGTAGADNNIRNNVPAMGTNNQEINLPAATDSNKEVTAAERDYQNIINKGKELTVLMNLMESAAKTAERNTDNNDINGNQNPTPEVSEIPDEENSEEEHDAEQEKANQQAWENLSAAQKKYLETLEAGRTRRKLILRCMRHPGEVRIDPLLTEVHDLSIERLDQLQQECLSDELVRECLSDNAVVKLDRNDIPNWNRAQRRTKNDQDPTKSGEGTDSDSDEDDEVKFVGTILRSKSKYGGAIDGAGSIAPDSRDQSKVTSKGNERKCKCGEHTTGIGETECSNCKRQFLTSKDLQDHLAKIGQVCHETGCQYQYGPKPVKRRRLDVSHESNDDIPVNSDVKAPWPKFLPKTFRCLVDLPKGDILYPDSSHITFE